MRYYRLYYFDRATGHINHFREFEAADDAAAIALANPCMNGSHMELWNCERRLKSWETAPYLE